MAEAEYVYADQTQDPVRGELQAGWACPNLHPVCRSASARRAAPLRHLHAEVGAAVGNDCTPSWHGLWDGETDWASQSWEEMT